MGLSRWMKEEKPVSEVNRFIKKTKINPNRPVRNRTAYNLFYKYQRKVLLNSIYSKDTVDKEECDDKESIRWKKWNCGKISNWKEIEYHKKKTVQEVHAELRMHFDELFGENRPVRQKRLHRKTSGTIRLHELTKIMALKWANANEDVRSLSEKRLWKIYVVMKVKCENIQLKGRKPNWRFFVKIVKICNWMPLLHRLSLVPTPHIMIPAPTTHRSTRHWLRSLSSLGPFPFTRTNYLDHIVKVEYRKSSIYKKRRIVLVKQNV